MSDVAAKDPTMLQEPDWSLVTAARTMTRQSNPTVFRLSRLLYGRQSFPYFLLGYAYFRWLDDLIDAPGATSDAIRAIAANQRTLLMALYDGQYPGRALRACPEEMLAEMVRYDRANGWCLRPYLLDMFSALEFDAGRRYRLSSQSDLDAYSQALGRSYTDVLQVFASLGSSVATDSLAHQAGFAAHQVHILRDLYVDLALGYCNISREDLARFRWTVDDLPNADLRPWVAATASKAHRAFQRGLQGITHIQSPRCRLLGYATSAHYMLILKGLHSNGFDIAALSPTSKVSEVRGLAWALLATFYPQAASGYLRGLDRYSTA